MKQHISKEDLLQLSPDQQEKPRKWWNPQEGNLFLDEFYTEKLYCEACMLEYRGKMLNMNGCLPLLSIGQCIELLESYTPKIEKGRHWMMEIITGKLPNYDFPKYQRKQLIDCLFEALKEVL